LLFAYTANRNR